MILSDITPFLRDFVLFKIAVCVIRASIAAKPIRAGHHPGMTGVQAGIRLASGGAGAPVAIRAGQKPLSEQDLMK